MRIPFEPSVQSTQGLGVGNTVNRNYGMRGLAINNDINQINQQTNQMMQGAMNNAFKTAGEIHQNHVDGQNSSDMAAARRIVLDNEQKMMQEIAQTNDPQKIQEITKRYEESTRKLLSGNNADGVPYFRNGNGKKQFTEGFLNDRVFSWHQKGSHVAFQKDIQNSRARLQLDIDGAMNSENLDDPEVKQTILENLDKMAHFGLPENEIQLMKNDALMKLDLKRIENHTVGFQQRVESILKNDNLSAKGHKSEIQKEIDTYEQYIDGLKHITPKGKHQYKARLQSSLKMVDAMVKSEKAQVKAQTELMQDNNEMAILNTRLKARSQGQIVSAKEILGIVNSNPNGYTEKFKKDLIESLNDEAEFSMKQSLSAEEFWNNEEQANKDLVTWNKVLTFEGSSQEWRELYTEVAQMAKGGPFSQKAASYLLSLDPSKQKPDAQKDTRKSLYSKQLDNILGLSLTKEQKEKLTSQTSVSTKYFDGEYDQQRFFMSDAGTEIVDMLEENQRLELKTRLIEDYEKIFKDKGRESADQYIKDEMDKVQKSVDDREYYNNYINTKIFDSESAPNIIILTNDKGEERKFDTSKGEFID